MRGFVSAFCALTLLAVASAQTTPTPAKKSPSAAAAKTSPSTPTKTAADSKAAITIDGLCPAGTPGGKAFSPTCKTVISEASMDKLINALNPKMTPEVKQNLGRSLSEWMGFAAEAHQLGLDKTQDFEEVLKFARTQLLAQTMAKKLQKDAENISPAELQKYFDTHKSELEDFTFVRVIVPRSTPSKDKPVDEAADKQFADQIRERLVKGEDAKTLQTEAFKHAGQTAGEPSVEMSPRKRGTLPPSQVSVFDLKPGEVSAVLPDPSAFFIYKLVSRTEPQLEKSGPEIKNALAKQRFEDAMEKMNLKFKAKLEESYFGPQQTRMPAGAPSMRAPGGQPPASQKMAPPPGQGSAPQGEAPQSAPTAPQVPK